MTPLENMVSVLLGSTTPTVDPDTGETFPLVEPFYNVDPRPTMALTTRSNVALTKQIMDLVNTARRDAMEAMREAAAQLLQGLGNNEHHPESLARRIRAIDPESLMGGGT